MKLYNVPDNSMIRVIKNEKVPPGALPIANEEILHFHHIDGMYSYCERSDGTVVHLVAWANVEIINDEEN